MAVFTAGQDNDMSVDMVTSVGDAITAGTVSLYLRAKNGDNAGKYFDGGTGTWVDEVLPAVGSATHGVSCEWHGVIPAAAWVAGTRYRLLGAESGGLNVPYSEDVVEERVAVTVVTGAATERQ